MANVDHNQGNLSGIDDVRARDEIRKLWSVIQVRTGKTGTGDDRFVTLKELRAVQDQVDNIKPTSVAAPSAQYTSSSSVGNVGGNVNLLPLNNVWTGTNAWTRAETGNSRPFKFHGLQAGALIDGVRPTILLEDTYNTLVDIRKTSDAQLQSSGGGNAALYVQHFVPGGVLYTEQTTTVGIRCQVESFQSSIAGGANDIVSGYFGIRNHGINSGGFGVHVDAYHVGTGATVTYGFSAEMYREFLDGKTIAFHARSISGTSPSGPYRDNDYAFLASPSYGGSTTKFKSVFSAGSDYIGNINCDFALDLAYATVAQAAIRLGYNQRVALEPTMKVGFRYDPVGKIVFYSNEGDTFSLGNDGSFRINGHESRQLMFLKATGEFEVGGAKGTMMKLETTGQFRVGDGSSNLMVLTPSTGFWIYNNVGQTLFYAPSNISDNFKFGLPKTAATAGVFMGYWLVDLGGFERAIPFYNAA